MGFVAVPANALIGMPDDVPGCDILVPFFYVSMPGFGNENTLLTVTDVKAPGGYVVPPIPLTTLHFTCYTIDSEPKHNGAAYLTWFDVWSDDMLSILMTMGPANRAAFEVDTDGDGVNDHWAGYIHFENDTFKPNPVSPVVWPLWNHLISHIYQVYLVAGMAIGYNGISWEYPSPNILLNVTTQWQTQTISDAFQMQGLEAFSANALHVGDLLLNGFALAGWPNDNAQWFRLMPRYFVYNDLGASLFMIWIEANRSRALWQETNAPANVHASPIPLPGWIHVYWFNEEEEALSADIPLPHELNILRVRDWLPAGLFTGYPWGGWVNIQTPDVFNRGWFYPVWDPSTNSNVVRDLGSYRNWAGYSWQRAYGPAAEAWEVLHPMHREAGINNQLGGFGPYVPPPWW